MKKLTTFIIALFVATLILAQVQKNPDADTGSANLKFTTTISDFTVTDTDGNLWNLYSHLDAGKTVILDLFFRD